MPRDEEVLETLATYVGTTDLRAEQADLIETEPC
jgi:hypothetical protein